jgi:hypothetical protein
MDFEGQKPVTDQYRDGWERIFRPKTRCTVREALESIGIPVVIDDSIPPTEIHLRHPNGRVDKIVGIDLNA